ncbi:AP-2 complex subunit mu [Pyrus ussuriensis x Pyrus communis]|uniref:AP-2 complex subunit mu n=1 Tax=Pyrus ussuriensis x Pyrus communis TaxID=2448454 RepID=A0A5N5HIK0_9ROSA|nr:AP-2 complex subunit mu [Pyrus ussuriensis x Pyrus communis]
MDFGYPQNLSPEILKLYITQEGVRSPFSSKVRCSVFALGVVIKIPVPKQTAKTSFQVTSVDIHISIQHSLNLLFLSLYCIDFLALCRIRKFPGQTEPTLSAEVELISTMTEKKSWTRPPIQMEFQVPMFTASGLRVRFLKVWEKSGYNTVEWVRYITKPGSYEIRC